MFRLFVFVFNTSFIPCSEFGSLYLGNLTVAARAVTHSHQCACSIFVCPNNGMASSVWDTAHSCVCVAFLCVLTMEWLAVFGILLLPVCTVFVCVPTMVWLAVFGILLIPTSVCSICVCSNNDMASSVWDTTHSYQCVQYFCVSQQCNG